VVSLPFSTMPWPWTWSANTSAGFTFLLLLVGLVVAVWHASEARKLRGDQARPFVVIEFDFVGGTIIELLIKNIGRTLARGVTFKFKPGITSTLDDNPSMVKRAELNVFRRGVPSLAPGREIRVLFDQFPPRLERGFPMMYEVEVSYRRPRGRKTLTDKTVLDLDAYIGTGGVTRHGLHDIHKQLEKIARDLHQWSAGTSGVKVMTREDLKRQRRELDAEYEAFERAAEAAEADDHRRSESRRR
jgi:hypothetical protein